MSFHLFSTYVSVARRYTEKFGDIKKKTNNKKKQARVSLQTTQSVAGCPHHYCADIIMGSFGCGTHALKIQDFKMNPRDFIVNMEN